MTRDRFSLLMLVVCLALALAIPVLADIEPDRQPVASSSPSPALDATYLRLDTTNDPLTGELEVPNSTCGFPPCSGPYSVAGNEGGIAFFDSDASFGSTFAYYDDAGQPIFSVFGESGTISGALTSTVPVVTALPSGGTQVQLGGSSTTAGVPAYSFPADLDTGLNRTGSNALSVETGGVARANVSNASWVINETGANYDFRVEGDTEPDLLFTDADTTFVGIGTSTPGLLGIGQGLTITDDSGIGVGQVALLEFQDSSNLTTGDVGVIDFYNASVRLGQMGVGPDGTTDSGKYSFWTKAAAGSLLERMRITSQGSTWLNELASTPATPSSGFGAVYPKTDGRLYFRNDAGTELDLTGDVRKVGTPVDNQVCVWTGDGTVEGDPNFTWDGSTLTLASNIEVNDGTAADPPYSFSSDDDNGMFLIGANNLGFSIAGSEVIDISISAVEFNNSIRPNVDDLRSLGTSSLAWQQGHINEWIGGQLTVTAPDSGDASRGTATISASPDRTVLLACNDADGCDFTLGSPCTTGYTTTTINSSGVGINDVTILGATGGPSGAIDLTNMAKDAVRSFICLNSGIDDWFVISQNDSQPGPITFRSSYSLSWGAKMDSTGEYMIANGHAEASQRATLDAWTEAPAPKTAVMNRLSWNSTNADATTVLKVLVDGAVEETITLTGASGVSTAVSTQVVQGELVTIEYDAGTAPDEMTVQLYLETAGSP